MNNSPIGVFDSGLGGLTVWSELYKRLPNESLIYYGDGKNCPYGNKTQQEVTEHVEFAVRQLIDMGVKMIVVACNAATAMSIDTLRANYTIPFVGLEPAVKPAASATRSGVIGILATAATLKGRHFQQAYEKYSSETQIIARVGEGFVELVEQDKEHSEEAYRTVKNVVGDMLDRGADQLVLGCTHYPFLTDVLNEIIGDRDVTLINPASAIERRVESILSDCDMFASKDNTPVYEFCTSSDEAYRQKLIAKSREALKMAFITEMYH